MFKKILNFVIGIVLLATVVFAGIQTVRVSSLSKSVEQYRCDLATAREANKRYADTYREATVTNREIGECLSRHISTISELREQLEEVKSGYEQMYRILKDVEDDSDIDIMRDSYNDNWGYDL